MQVLPFARVKRLMREEADVKNIATEANYVLGRAAVGADALSQILSSSSGEADSSII